jgi:amidohydrolase
MKMRLIGFCLTCLLQTSAVFAAETASTLQADVERLAVEVEPKVIAWRRDIHEHPELGNREVRTAKLVAAHLRQLGFEVKTGVAHTGVVALLAGSKPGPVVALRADMDALPVTEAVDIPFRSTAKAEYEGRETGVMHACGHDAHVAILMGVAEILARLKDKLPGSVKFIFQPAEEGVPPGEEGGAALMIKEGVMQNPIPDAIFGLHVASLHHTGQITYRAGPFMAAADVLRITVKGRQTHGAAPWGGVDPIVVAAQIVLGLQTIVSRQVNLTTEPAVLTIGSIHGGNRFNIIPEEVTMVGTLRTLDEAMRLDIHQRIKRTTEMIAAGSGASAEVSIESPYAVSINNEQLTAKMLPTLKRVAGEQNVTIRSKVTGSEDFSFFQQKRPGFFYFVGVTPVGSDLTKVAYNHSPRFYIEEKSLLLGVRSLANMAVDYLQMGQ